MSELALEAKLIGMDEIIDPEGLSIDTGLHDPVMEHPVQKLFEQGALAKFDDGWDEQISAAPLEKRASEESDPRRLWKTIVRTERFTDEDGGVWSRGFNKNNELVDARLLIGAE